MSGENFEGIERLRNTQEIGGRLEQNLKQQADLTADLQRSLALQALWSHCTNWPDLFGERRSARVSWVRTPLSQPNPRFILRVSAMIGSNRVERDFEPEDYEPFMSVPEDIVQRDREERRK